MALSERTGDRRVLRLSLPPCQQCASTNVHVATRVDRFLYIRCRDCSSTWSVRKPTPAWDAPMRTDRPVRTEQEPRDSCTRYSSASSPADTPRT